MPDPTLDPSPVEITHFRDKRLFVKSLVVDGVEYAGAMANVIYFDNIEGVNGNGTDNDYDYLVEALDSLDTSRGGCIVFGQKQYRFNLTSAGLVLPNDGLATPNQKPITLIGQGAHWSGEGQAINGSTVLDFRGGDSTYGKIISLGLGLLVIEGLTITEGGNSSGNPFLYTTNTTIHVRGNAFMGSTNKSGTGCDQDGIVCGGTTSNYGGTKAAPFQGYGTVIERNYFNRVRRYVYGRVAFNASIIRENTGWTFCGGTAAIELDGDPVSSARYAVGNKIDGNLIEGSEYTYGVKLSNASQNTLIANGLYDGDAGTLATVRLESTAVNNLVIGSVNPAGMPYLSDAAAAPANHFISMTAGDVSKLAGTYFNDFSYPTELAYALLSGGHQKATVQPRDDQSEGAILLQIKRSADDDVNAGGLVAKWLQQGDFTVYNSSGASSTWSTAGRTWTADGTGGGMAINSGSSGSYLDLTNFGVRFFSQAGAYQCRFGAGLAGLKWGTSSTADDLGISRNAAGVMEVNSGTAGTLRDIKVRSTVQSPPASVAPAVNGEMVVEATSNTTLTFKLKGSDGTVRSGTITLS